MELGRAEVVSSHSPGLPLLSRAPRFCSVRQLAGDPRRDEDRKLVLKIEDVAQPAVEAVRPDAAQALRLGQLDHDGIRSPSRRTLLVTA